MYTCCITCLIQIMLEKLILSTLYVTFCSAYKLCLYPVDTIELLVAGLQYGHTEAASISHNDNQMVTDYSSPHLTRVIVVSKLKFKV